MEKGELLDMNYVTSFSQKWAKRAGSFMGVGVKGAEKITFYKCKKCGYIENYVEKK